MATIDNAVRFLEQNDTPYWTIHSGSSKVGQSSGTDNLQDSISRFRECMELQSPGNYKLVCAKNPNDNRGGLTFNFSKGQTSHTQTNSMQSAPTTNAYGVSDLVYKQIVEETRRTLLFEQMADKFGPLVDLVKDMEKRLNKLEKDFYEELTPATTEVVFTKEYATQQLHRLFNALADATGDPAVATDVIEKIADGINADPEFSKQILTPENIAKAYALKAKSDAGTITLTDVERAFPIIAEKVPFWSMFKTFKL